MRLQAALWAKRQEKEQQKICQRAALKLIAMQTNCHQAELREAAAQRVGKFSKLYEAEVKLQLAQQLPRELRLYLAVDKCWATAQQTALHAMRHLEGHAEC